MPLMHLLILSLVQGITEFLPISSSGHLVLVHEYLNTDLADNHYDLLIDVAVHIGTLFAVLLYFRSDLITIFRSISFKKTVADDQQSNLCLLILIGSLPVIIAGFLLHAIYPQWLRDPLVVGWATIIFGIVLYISDRFFKNERTLETIGLRDALYIGLAQILALIPGTSRSGITMSAARFLGITRTDCARFSLLLGIVAISGAGVLGAKDLLAMGNIMLGFDVLVAVVLSFVSGYISILIMMKWLEKASFTPFVIYRLILGVGLLALVYSGVM